jgi:hypothetical protein
VFGLFARFTLPLAIMPSADQVPIKRTHSKMPWPVWVVLIAGSTGAALSAVHEEGCVGQYPTEKQRSDPICFSRICTAPVAGGKP